MDKKKIGAKTFLYPMPTTLVGALVDGKPNSPAVAYCGIINHNPPYISVSLSQKHDTNKGVREHGTFSVNIPSADMFEITDYCGLVSGAKTDKSDLFETFYGGLETAPMIAECPLNLECRTVRILEYSPDHVFIGEIVEAYAAEEYLTNGLPDIKKMDPLLFSMHDMNYWRVGGHVARAFHSGKNFEPRK
jgi:flavin reductase (DIM6/NTAB) family NADH-FMN oxidoreductase RutF